MKEVRVVTDYISETCLKHTFSPDDLGHVDMMHVPCPDISETIPIFCVKVRIENDVPTVYIDTITYAAYIEKEHYYQLSVIRDQRNQLLKDSDFSMLSDIPLSDDQKQQWREYRQQLRDFIPNIKDIFNPPPFPQRPS